MSSFVAGVQKKLDGAGVAFFIILLVLVRVGRNLFYPSLEKRKMFIFRATSALVDTHVTFASHSYRKAFEIVFR